MSNVPSGAAILLAFIYRAETGKTGPDAYRTIIGHREGQLSKPVTDFTLEELLSAQKVWGTKWNSSAAGAPQIIRKTLLALCAKLDLKAEQKFTPELQDILTLQLLKQRGFDQFIAGTMSLKSFALALAKEWASMPVLEPVQGAHGKLTRGQSYYDGDGMNGATVSAGDLEATLAEVLNEARRAPAAPFPPPPDIPVPEPDQPPPERGGINWLLIGIIALVVILAAFGFSFFVPIV